MSILDRFIPADKQLHVAAGVIVAAVVAVASGSVVWAIYASALAGAAKEGFDAAANYARARRGEPASHDVDAMDALTTLAGGAIGALAVATIGFAQ